MTVVPEQQSGISRHPDQLAPTQRSIQLDTLTNSKHSAETAHAERSKAGVSIGVLQPLMRVSQPTSCNQLCQGW